MSKYDFEIDLSQNTSTGIILNQIQNGSVVLEFGCATGRMTRYMKEALDCRVYIVEYDHSAYETALQYAEDGLCDDILTFRWVEKFKGITFDAIIFADVLEHLTAPEKVLEEAAKLLKDTGCIYVSVPNITHNDILLKAYAEHFDYTATGLLDDTHVHFWGLENIKALSGKCGLRIRKIEGTYCNTGDSEQRAQANNILLENILRERQCGEVYQFVVTFDKSTEADAATAFRTPCVRSCIYLDKGNGFNSTDLVFAESELSSPGTYRIHYVLEQTEELCAIRFDPVEGQGCIVRSAAIRQGENELPLHYLGGIELDNGVLLPGNDPMVYADVLPGNDSITIDAEFALSGEAYIDILEASSAGQRTVIENLTAGKQDLQRTVEALSGDREALRNALAGLTAEKEALHKTIAALNSENEELRRDVCAYIILVNNKEKHALAVEAELKYYQNLEVVKLRRFIIRALRFMKRCIKRVLGKRGQA